MEMTYKNLANAYNLIERLWQEEFKNKTDKADILMLIKQLLLNFAQTEFTTFEWNEFLTLLDD